MEVIAGIWYSSMGSALIKDWQGGWVRSRGVQTVQGAQATSSGTPAGTSEA
jgi:hypothetical protein